MMTDRQFQKEYERLYMPLGMYALRIVGNVDDAEDVVQSVFADVWQIFLEKPDTFDNFKAYMYRAVRNAALKRAGAQMRFDSLDAESVDVSDDDVDTSERDACLWRAIDALPERCREVFLMSKRDGMSHAEIAAELGISEKTVESQITKAFSRLCGNGRLLAGDVFFLPFL